MPVTTFGSRGKAQMVQQGHRACVNVCVMLQFPEANGSVTASSQRDNKCPLICRCTLHVWSCSPQLSLSVAQSPARMSPAHQGCICTACWGGHSGREAASPTPSLVWECSGHGEERVLGMQVQRYHEGKEQVNFVLWWNQCWHCWHCHPGPRNVG